MVHKVLVCDSMARKGLDALSSAGFEVTYRPDISYDEVLASVGGYEVVVVRSRTQITRQVIEAGRKLKAIGRPGVGVDNIDVKAAEEAGVAVVNTPEALTNAVAELVLGLMISLSREIPRADASMKRGEWQKQHLIGTELCGKTLGVVGMGRIGIRVAQLAKAFGMKILGYDIIPISEKVLDELESKIVSLDTLLSDSDYVTIHVPLTPETQRMINSKTLRLMKKSSFIINTSRGKVVDEKALCDALKSNVIKGAALDVFEIEPPVGSELVKLPNVVATPHIGSQTAEAQDLASLKLADNLVSVLSKRGYL